MASRRISSLVTTVLPRRLITPFSPPPSFFHRINKIHTLSKFSPSSPTHLVFHPRPFSTAPLSHSCLKQAKENLIKKLREEGNPFQIVDISRDYRIVLQREYGGDMITIEAYLEEEEECFDVNVQRGVATLGFECKFNNLENLHNKKEEVEIVSVKILKAGEHHHGNGKNTQYFEDIDEDLQKGFLDYLDKRGIKNDLVAWLSDYRKVSVEYNNASEKDGETYE